MSNMLSPHKKSILRPHCVLMVFRRRLRRRLLTRECFICCTVPEWCQLSTELVTSAVSLELLTGLSSNRLVYCHPSQWCCLHGLATACGFVFPAEPSPHRQNPVNENRTLPKTVWGVDVISLPNPVQGLAGFSTGVGLRLLLIGLEHSTRRTRSYVVAGVV